MLFPSHDHGDENGANGSTTKQTDANGVVVVYVEEGEYDEQANNGKKRRVLIGSKSNNIISYGTTAEIEALRPQRTGSRIENRERANAQYVLAPAGYVAQAGDIVAANGRVWELQINGPTVADWWASLQDAVDRVKSNGGGKIYCPNTYRLTSTLLLDGGGVSLFGSEPERVYDAIVPASKKGVINADFTNGPALLISD